MQQTPGDRIKEFMRELDISQKQFAENIGVPATTLNSIFTRGTQPSISVINAISDRYKTLNVNWILTGEGSMMRSLEDFHKEITIHERIKQICKYYCNDSYVELSKKIGILPEEAEEMTRHSFYLDKPILNRIMSAFPDVSADWLLTGEGTMLKNDEVEVGHKDGKFYFNFPKETQLLDISERIKLILKNENLHLREFVKLTGIRQDVINRILKRESTPGVETWSKIINSFPDYSENWIRTGKGQIFIEHEVANESQLHPYEIGIDKSKNIASNHGSVSVGGDVQGQIVTGDNNTTTMSRGTELNDIVHLKERIKLLESEIQELKKDKILLQDFINVLQNKK